MPTTRHVVAITEPVSNSITASFNSYKLTFSDEHAFNQTFSSFRSRRRIIGTMSAGFVNGVWTEWIDFTVRDGPPWWDGVPEPEPTYATWGTSRFGEGRWSGVEPVYATWGTSRFGVDRWR